MRGTSRSAKPTWSKAQTKMSMNRLSPPHTNNSFLKVTGQTEFRFEFSVKIYIYQHGSKSIWAIFFYFIGIRFGFGHLGHHGHFDTMGTLALRAILARWHDGHFGNYGHFGTTGTSALRAAVALCRIECDLCCYCMALSENGLPADPQIQKEHTRWSPTHPPPSVHGWVWLGMGPVWYMADQIALARQFFKEVFPPLVH